MATNTTFKGTGGGMTNFQPPDKGRLVNCVFDAHNIRLGGAAAYIENCTFINGGVFNSVATAAASFIASRTHGGIANDYRVASGNTSTSGISQLQSADRPLSTENITFDNNQATTPKLLWDLSLTIKDITVQSAFQVRIAAFTLTSTGIVTLPGDSTGGIVLQTTGAHFVETTAGSPPSFGAARYWVGGTGNWSDTAHWATTSGGAGGSSVPTVANEAVFDENSILGSTITVDVDAVCKEFDAVIVSGDLTLTFTGPHTINALNGYTFLSALTRRLVLYFTGGVDLRGQLLAINPLGSATQLGNVQLKINYSGAASSAHIGAEGPSFAGTKTDPVLLVKNTLSTYWLSANTDGKTPLFTEPDETERQVQGDLVRVYTGRPETRRRLDIRHDFGMYESPVVIDVITYGAGSVKPKAHATKIRQEIERIINAHKTNPDAYWQFLEMDAIGGVDAEYATFYRFLANVIAKRWAAVPT